MRNKRVEAILQEIARKDGSTVDEVRQAIQDTLDNAQRSPDPEVQKRWKQIRSEVGEITPDTMIPYLSRICRDG